MRDAVPADAEAAAVVLRRSIIELCSADHNGDPATLAAWVANKSAENLARWIEGTHVMLTFDGFEMLGVAAMTGSGEITLNYVSPAARFQGVSTGLLARLEQRAHERGIEVVTLESTQTAHRFYLARGYRDLVDPSPGRGAYRMAKVLNAKRERS